MNTVKKAAVLTAAACAMVMSGAGLASADGSDVSANAAAIGSPGVLSGNIIQTPINMPINFCGNSLGLFSLLSPAFGNTCINANERREEREHRFIHREHGFRMHAWCEARGEDEHREGWGEHRRCGHRDGGDDWGRNGDRGREGGEHEER